MKLNNKSYFVILLFCFCAPQLAQAYQVEPTTLIFVRHAERAEDGTSNPPISEKGKERSVNLYHSLSNYSINAIYSTSYKRTMMTVKPTSDSLGIEVQEYGFDDIEGLLTKIISENSGFAVLIVGHSNTTPSLTNMVLGEERFEKFEETDFGDMLIVTTTEFGKGEVVLKEF
ncbi:MAG: phosphoglycerate mutase family protein [Balneolaceae bacterium]